MKYRKLPMILAAAMLLGPGTSVIAATEDEAVRKAEEEKLQAQLEAEYKKALADVEKERQAAEASMEKAHRQLKLVSEQRKQQSSIVARHTLPNRQKWPKCTTN